MSSNKVELNNLANLQNDNTVVATINANNNAIETAMNNTLSLDGMTPNTMLANLDMNSKRVINLPYPVTNEEPLRFGDFKQFTISPTIGATAFDISYTNPSVGGIAQTVGLKLKQSFDIRDFGALCDGATDDTAAIQKAVTAAQAVGGKVQLFGRCKVSSQITITNNVSLVGVGKDTTYFLPSSNAFSVINFSPVGPSETILLSGFSILAPSLGVNTVPAIQLGNGSFDSYNCIVRDVGIYNFGAGIYCLNCQDQTIDNCLIQYYLNYGIRVENPIAPDSGGAIIINNQIINGGTVAPAAQAIEWLSGGGCSIHNNKFLSNAYGLNFIMSGATTEFHFTNNLVFGSTISAVSLTGPGALGYQFFECIVNNNIFDSCINVLTVTNGTATTWLYNLLFTNNCISTSFNPVAIQVDIQRTQGFIVANNVFYLNGSTTPTPIRTTTSADSGIIGPNVRTGTWGANSISSTNTTTIGGG